MRWAFWLLATGVLIVLAIRMLREVLRPHVLALGEGDSATPRSRRQLFGYGLSLALASPTGILWFAAIGGAAIASFGGDRGQTLPLMLGFGLAGIAWSALLAFGLASSRKLLGPRLVRGLSALSALLFLYFAVRIFVDGLGDLRNVMG